MAAVSVAPVDLTLVSATILIIFSEESALWNLLGGDCLGIFISWLITNQNNSMVSSRSTVVARSVSWINDTRRVAEQVSSPCNADIHWTSVEGFPHSLLLRGDVSVVSDISHLLFLVVLAHLVLSGVWVVRLKHVSVLLHEAKCSKGPATITTVVLSIGWVDLGC